MEVVVSRRDMRRALDELTVVHSLIKAGQAIVERLRRPPKWLLRYSEEEEAEERAYSEEVVRLALHRLESLVMREWRKYPHIVFGLATPLPPASLACFVACPPQITYPEFGAVYTPSSYINVLFFPIYDRERRRVHRDRLARACYAIMFEPMFRHAPILKPPLRDVFGERLATYMARGKSHAHAYRLALRDLVRVLIGCIWLVWSCAALKQGVIKRIVLPYHLKRGRHRMIDPHEVVTRPTALEPELLTVLDGCSWRLCREQDIR